MTLSLEESTVRIWDVPSGKELYQPGDFLAFSPDSKKIVTTESDNIRILDADTGKELQTLAGSYLAFAPDGEKIAVATTNTVRIWAITDSENSENDDTSDDTDTIRKLTVQKLKEAVELLKSKKK